MRIRNETPSDIDAIARVTRAAFETLPISNHTEQYIIESLRGSGALTISLVAEIHGRVVGHVAFSPVTISDGSTGWYGLGPVSVSPSCQKQGIGTSLINEGLSMLKESDALGCALVGAPAFYKRFGFRNLPSLVHQGIPPEFFLVLPFTENVPGGIVVFHEAFSATGE